MLADVGRRAHNPEVVGSNPKRVSLTYLRRTPAIIPLSLHSSFFLSTKDFLETHSILFGKNCEAIIVEEQGESFVFNSRPNSSDDKRRKIALTEVYQ